jgi:hypothetical protein
LSIAFPLSFVSFFFVSGADTFLPLAAASSMEED